MSRGDLDAVMSLFAPDAVYDASDARLGTFEGEEAIRGFVEDWRRSSEDYRYENEEILDLGHGVTLSLVREERPLVRRQRSRRAAGGAPRHMGEQQIEWFEHSPTQTRPAPPPNASRSSSGRRCRSRTWMLTALSRSGCCCGYRPRSCD